MALHPNFPDDPHTMNDVRAKALCLALMKADYENEVVGLLRDAGFWDMQAYWRYHGDRETNYNSAGNQQGRPSSASASRVATAAKCSGFNKLWLFLSLA